MALLVLDSCAVLHLKQLSDETHDVVGLVDALGTLGVRFASTRKVHGEHLEMTMSHHVDRWKQSGTYEALPVTLGDRKQALNKAREINPMPGRGDVDLVALTRREGGVLLTHDGPAAAMASRLKLLTVDVVDVAALLEARGILPWSDLDARLERLDSFAWRPDDWAGSVSATAASRSVWPRLLARLETWLAS